MFHQVDVEELQLRCLVSVLPGPRSAYKNTGRMSHGSVKVISQTPDWCGRHGGRSGGPGNCWGWGWGLWNRARAVVAHHTSQTYVLIRPRKLFSNKQAHSCNVVPQSCADKWRLKGAERTTLTNGDRGLCWQRGISALISWSRQIELESVNQASGILAVGAVCTLGFTLSHIVLRPRRKAFWFYNENSIWDAFKCP